ncbi:hypothetical protein [Paenibacillus piscarius]|uniref:hypothetical protein n=1 Tax=Paenibacillus piscarius TaxID=1089681 RepID=UPI001EE78A17|nr:hypothetical protein [Paenibacillus piscarius]
MPNVIGFSITFRPRASAAPNVIGFSITFRQRASAALNVIGFSITFAPTRPRTAQFSLQQKQRLAHTEESAAVLMVEHNIASSRQFLYHHLRRMPATLTGTV